MFYYLKFYEHELLLNMDEFSYFEIQTHPDNLNTVTVMFKFFNQHYISFDINLFQSDDIQHFLKDFLDPKDFLDCNPILQFTDLVNLQNYAGYETSIQNKIIPFLISKKSLVFIYTLCNQQESILQEKNDRQIVIKEVVSDIISTSFFNMLKSHKYSL